MTSTVKEALWKAVENNDLNTFKTLIELEEVKKIVYEPKYSGYPGITETGKTNLLQLICKLGRTDMMKMSLDAGYSVTLTKQQIESSWDHLINIACQHNNKDLVILLLDHGADLNQFGRYYKYTPLHVASSQGHTEVVKLLLEKGADPTIPSANIPNQGFQYVKPIHVATNYEIYSMLHQAELEWNQTPQERKEVQELKQEVAQLKAKLNKMSDQVDILAKFFCH